MKIKVLTENAASGKFLAEHGLSYLIQHDGINILFDTGHTDVFLKNAQKLDVDINSVENVVISHGHWDHGDGLQYIQNKKLICHPGIFKKRYEKNRNENIGIALSYEQLNEKFDIISSVYPYNISENIIFLGQIPHLNSYETQTTPFILENGDDDYLIDDSGLVIKQGGEIIIISGCAHSGICNMVEHAKNTTGIEKIRAVIGGFHLKYNNRQTSETINYFKQQGVKSIYPSHCTELPALSAFYNKFKIKQLKAGMILDLN